MNKARKGRNLENRAKKLLEACGYLVIRSAASKGPFDLVAIKERGVVRLIQVKANKGISKEERELLQELAHKYVTLSVECWTYFKGERTPLIEIF